MSVNAEAFTVIKLYRDCMRMADWIASKNGAQGAMMRQQIRQAFVSRKHLTDPQEIEAAKADARRGLSNLLFMEAQRMAAEEKDTKGDN
ncbi:hypothetical protein QBZ16_003608 [Prototheca wickerhamii]|uniref:Complex 1 LYR protein domain-containing protein n=1 Tax=Prototheca wickerhamii TaxID=3111 RepID=A0AAD9MLW0_PROWI|nr:hypothetical protein QBZ16_003608 [Prototheca wickerhamii]